MKFGNRGWKATVRLMMLTAMYQGFDRATFKKAITKIDRKFGKERPKGVEQLKQIAGRM